MGSRRDNCNRYRRLSAALSAALCVVILAGCSVSTLLRPDTYEVRRGDSLSSIAATYGLRWRELARWNDIPPPYRIEVGQRLSLDPFPPLDYRPSDNRPPPRRVESPPRDAQRAPADSGPAVTRLPTGPAPEQASAPPPDASPERQNTDAKPPPVPEPVIEPAPTTARGWRWPLAVDVLRAHDSERTRHGMDLFGEAGIPIYAARSGRVVYSGPGLQGYGQLIIIKHAGRYLSAYGFNERVLVDEGGEVLGGQHIADMGVGPQNQAALHFEIRHDGEPINPATVLPKL